MVVEFSIAELKKKIIFVFLVKEQENNILEQYNRMIFHMKIH
nr:MAG TPA: hypothetical protein [Caudoviricetes sp.]